MNKAFVTDYYKVITNLLTAGEKYIKENKELKAMVLGISGGVDSAITAYLARQVCNSTGLKLIGYYLPIINNKDDEGERAIRVGEKYCHIFEIKELHKAYQDLIGNIDPALSTINEGTKIRAGNIKARVRMIHLYNMAAYYSGMVLSTDNLTEALVGFFTICGDVGDFGFIQNLWKTEVFGLSDYIGGCVKECGDAKPTDGLGVSNSDLDQLLPGWDGSWRDGYEVVDRTLINFLAGQRNNIDHPVIKRHLKTMYKRSWPMNITRETAIYGVE